MEYSRKIGTDGSTAVPAVPRIMNFGSVFLISAPESEAAGTTLPALAVSGQPQGVNVAEILLREGFATVVQHKDFLERSNYYNALLAVESKASKSSKNLYSQKAHPVTHINGLSVNTKKASEFLPFLQRQRCLPATVDHVFSGHRFKLVIPRDMCAIMFSLTGVRCPGIREPYSEEAIAFMRRRILQRDVEIEVVGVDKNGSFQGSMWEGKENVSIALLEAELATLHSSFITERMTEGHLLLRAELSAKKKNLKVWEGNHLKGNEKEANKATSCGANRATTSTEAKAVPVHGSDAIDGGRFYVQMDKARVDSVGQALQSLKLEEKPLPPGGFASQKGDNVAAQFLADISWYRALIVNAPRQGGRPSSEKAEYEVFYIDYGNQETVPLSRLRPLETSSLIPAQGLAQLCSLAHTKVPELEEDCGDEAAVFLAREVTDKALQMKVEDKDSSGGKVRGRGTGPRSIVTLIDPESSKTIQAQMLQLGLAKVEKVKNWNSPEKKEVFAKYEEYQTEAKKNRLNI